MYSITKYINGKCCILYQYTLKQLFMYYIILLGHSDVLMGVVCTNDAKFAEKMKFLQLGLLLYI